MAEAFSRKYYPKHNSKSAGVNVMVQGDIVPIDVWNIMIEKGIDLKHHRSNMINPKMVDSADKIFVLCPEDECPNYLINADMVDYWKIDDPVGGYDSMVAARDNIEKLVKNLF